MLLDYEGFDTFVNPNQVEGRFDLASNTNLAHTSNLGIGAFDYGRCWQGLNINYWFARDFANQNIVWINFHFFRTGFQIPTQHFFELRDGSSTQLALRNNDQNRLTLYRGSTLIATASEPFTDSVWAFVQIRALIASSGGSCEVWLDNKKVIDFSGNTQNSANAWVNRWYLKGSESSRHRIDNLVVYNETGAVPNERTPETRIYSDLPESDDLAEWTPNAGGNNYSRVYQNPPDGDTTYVQAASAPLTDRYGLASSVPPGSTIYALAVQGVFRKDDVGDNDVKFLVRTNSTDFEAAAALSAAGSYAWRRSIWTENPDTAAPWTPSAANASQIGIKRVL